MGLAQDITAAVQAARHALDGLDEQIRFAHDGGEEISEHAGQIGTHLIVEAGAALTAKAAEALALLEQLRECLAELGQAALNAGGGE